MTSSRNRWAEADEGCSPRIRWAREATRVAATRCTQMLLNPASAQPSIQAASDWMARKLAGLADLEEDEQWCQVAKGRSALPIP